MPYNKAQALKICLDLNKINYNAIEGFTGATKALYNGNIAETLWSNNTDGGFVRAYGYLYDNLNRLKDATYYKTGSLPYVSKAYDENLTYDKNGNIMTLKRNGGSDVSPATARILSCGMYYIKQYFLYLR